MITDLKIKCSRKKSDCLPEKYFHNYNFSNGSLVTRISMLHFTYTCTPGCLTACSTSATNPAIRSIEDFVPQLTWDD